MVLTLWHFLVSGWRVLDTCTPGERRAARLAAQRAVVINGV